MEKVVYKGEKMSLDKATRMVIHHSRVELNPEAEAYLQKLGEASNMYGEKGVRSQIRYIASNINNPTPEGKLLRKQLKAIAKGMNPPESLDQAPDELEDSIGEISQMFERFTRGKIDQSEKITMKDFRQFAGHLNYNIDKVLEANPWLEKNLTEEVKEKL